MKNDNNDIQVVSSTDSQIVFICQTRQYRWRLSLMLNEKQYGLPNNR